MAVSKIGGLSCRICLGAEELIIAMRVHVDESGKSSDGFVVLAAFAANDETWKGFEIEWDKILKSHDPIAQYIHMNEVARCIDGFSYKLGWTLEKAFGLVNRCLSYISFIDKQKLHMFYCTVDLEARRRLIGEGLKIPEAVELCVEFCYKGILGWCMEEHIAKRTNLSFERAHFIFDRNEEFYSPFKNEWNLNLDKYEQKGEESPWMLIDGVTEADMKKVPGIQASDIVAWSVNRDNGASENMPGKKGREILEGIVPWRKKVWDEQSMRSEFGPMPEKI